MKKKNIIISIALILLSIIYTMLVKNIDLKPIGPNESIVGFADINKLFANLIGTNMTIYKITEYIGLIPFIIALMYVFAGLRQLVQRRSLLNVDKELYILGLFYLLVLGIYIFFEKNIINYRPVLIDDALEASYPSSHTLMSICICMSSVIINKKIFHNKIANVENIISIITMILIVFGRAISGVHWFTDILGGIIISTTLLVIFYTIIDSIKVKIEKIEF